MGGRMIIDRGTPRGHRCQPPRDSSFGMVFHAQGSVWECDCGLRWVVTQGLSYHREWVLEMFAHLRRWLRSPHRSYR
jgi:hypothetical protein